MRGAVVTENRGYATGAASPPIWLKALSHSRARDGTTDLTADAGARGFTVVPSEGIALRGRTVGASREPPC